ncbi:DUF5719 family protein [Pseudarthrobacter sp. P1]|uniref:DUF5719 family protein n=1 Tax=Pseudarthrobacter sp. P1 TaxID=3418418 RepID=UPI003CF81BE7
MADTARDDSGTGPGAASTSGRRPPRRKRVWLSVAAGAGTAILAGAVVAGSVLVPAVSAAGTAELPPTVLPVGQNVAVCPGPTQLLTGSDAGTDPQFSPDSSTASSTVSALLLGSAGGSFGAGVVAPLAGGAPLATLSAGTTSTSTATAQPEGGWTAKVAGPLSAVAPSVLLADPAQNRRAPAAAVFAAKNDDGDLRGLAAAACQTPGNDLWIAGASTTVGRTAVLNISNASQTPATVSLDLFTTSGPLQAAGAKGLLVAPGSTRAVVLAGLAAGEEQLSLHLKSTGGPVAAFVQQSVLRGLTPGGVEFLAPANAPALRQVVPGVRLGDPGLAGRISGQSGYADAAPSLQVTVPGAKDAVVQVKVLGATGQQALPNGGVFTARAGAATALDLSGLPAGDYTLDISADASFTASAKVSAASKEGEPVDVAFTAAAARLGDGQLLVLPRGLDSKLTFAAPAGQAKVNLTPVSAGGAALSPKTIDVDGGKTVTVDPRDVAGGPVAAFVLSATGDSVYGAQLVSSSGSMVSVLGIPREGASAQTLKVLLGY